MAVHGTIKYEDNINRQTNLKYKWTKYRKYLDGVQVDNDLQMAESQYFL